MLALLNLNCSKRIETEAVPDNTIQKKYLDLTYESGSSSQKLDIFLPDTVLEKNPVIIMIHGGAWRGGDKSNYRASTILTALRNRGYAVVPVNYRLSGETKFPAQIFDIKSSIRWVKANATKYKLDSGKIGVWGQSAGGHLAALAGVSGNIAALEDFNQENENVSSSVQAVIDWYGPSDFLKMDSMATTQGCSTANHNAATSGESELVGFPITSRPDLVAMANPITYITDDCPPIFIEHGLDDCTVPYGQSQLLYDSLLPKLGNQKVKLKLLPASGHGSGQFTKIATILEVIDFLDTHLK
jgi:acetyl esterase/lipase